MTGIKEFLIFVAVLKSMLRKFLIISLVLCSFFATGQVSLQVTPADTTVCFRDSVAFTAIVTGTGTATVTYRWQKNYIDIPGGNAADSIYAISHVSSADPGLYRCIIAVNGVIADTSNDALLGMHPRMYFDTLYRYNPLGCPTVDTTTQPLCKGQFKTLVSGGVLPYSYEWNGGHSQDTIVFGLCPGYHKLIVTDANNCSIDSIYYVDVLRLPKVDFDFSPTDTIYLTNPTVQVAFPDSMRHHLTNWTWDFGDKTRIANINPVSHTYSDTLKPGFVTVRLIFTDVNGCDTIITHELNVKIADLDIPNLFTPNGDLINDKFAIELKDDRQKDFREAYLGNEFEVFDRWGKKVYKEVDYKSENWDGDRLADGTYFYILNCHGQYGDEVFKGSVTILRGK